MLYPDTQSIPASAAPKILNRPYSITAEVSIPKDGAEGVLLSMGGNDGGISFYVKPTASSAFVHNYLALDYFYVRSDDARSRRAAFPEHGVRADRAGRSEERQRLAGHRDAARSTGRRSGAEISR